MILDRVAYLLSRPVLPLLVAAGSLSAFAAGYLGVLSPAFDMIAQFTAHWLVIAVIATVASFVPRYAYFLVGLSLPAALLLPAALAAWYAAPLDGDVRTRQAGLAIGMQRSDTMDDRVRLPLPDQRRLKLMLFNSLNPNADTEAVWSEIIQHDADLVSLVEFGPNKQALIPRLAKRYPYHRNCSQDWNCALGFFSRIPVQSFELVGVADDRGPPLIRAELAIGEKSVTLITSHILSPNHGPRANYIELDHLARRIAKMDGPVILAGDLNTTIWGNAFDNFRRRSGLLHMGHLVPTWPVRPVPLAQIGIDHVFTSGDIEVSDVAVGRAAGSDHLPLVVMVDVR